MKDLLSTPLFGILISLIAFEIGTVIFKKTKLPILNPLLIGIALVIAFLKLCKIPLDSFKVGGDFISFLLGPATVVLAVPLYKKIQLLKKHWFPILFSITIGSSIGMISIIFLSKFFNLNDVLMASLVPKSITTPIGIEVSKQIGGMPPITIAAIIITGIAGAVLGPFVCKTCRIKHEIAVGLSLGTASHAVGTSKAIEIGEIEGAMSGLAIGLAGLVTVFLGPYIFHLFM